MTNTANAIDGDRILLTTETARRTGFCLFTYDVKGTVINNGTQVRWDNGGFITAIPPDFKFVGKVSSAIRKRFPS